MTKGTPANGPVGAFAAISAAFLLGGAMTVVQTVPTYQLTKLSVASLRSQWYVTGGGLYLESLASLVVPNYYHIFDPSLYRLPYDFTFLYVYCGMIAVPFVLAALFLRRARYNRSIAWPDVLNKDRTTLRNSRRGIATISTIAFIQLRDAVIGFGRAL